MDLVVSAVDADVTYVPINSPEIILAEYIDDVSYYIYGRSKLCQIIL